MNYYIRPSKKEDCYTLSKTLRECDVQEIFASSGSNPVQSLVKSYICSQKHCYSIMLDGEVVGMFGINKVNKNVGSPWLLGSDNLTKHKFKFYKLSKSYLSKFMEEYNVLFNYVDQRNSQSKRWLKGLGFQFTKLVPQYGYEKKPFYEFIKARYV